MQIHQGWNRANWHFKLSHKDTFKHSSEVTKKLWKRSGLRLKQRIYLVYNTNQGQLNNSRIKGNNGIARGSLGARGRYSGPTDPHTNLAQVLCRMSFLTQSSQFLWAWEQPCLQWLGFAPRLGIEPRFPHGRRKNDYWASNTLVIPNARIIINRTIHAVMYWQYSRPSDVYFNFWNLLFKH